MKTIVRIPPKWYDEDLSVREKLYGPQVTPHGKLKPEFRDNRSGHAARVNKQLKKFNKPDHRLYNVYQYCEGNHIRMLANHQKHGLKIQDHFIAVPYFVFMSNELSDCDRIILASMAKHMNRRGSPGSYLSIYSLILKATDRDIAFRDQEIKNKRWHKAVRFIKSRLQRLQNLDLISYEIERTSRGSYVISCRTDLYTHLAHAYKYEVDTPFSNDEISEFIK